MDRYIAVIGLIMAVIFAGCGGTTVEKRSAGIAFDRGDYMEAIELYEESLQTNPEDAQAWYELGLAYRYTDQYKKMSEAFDNSLAISDRYYNDIYDVRDELWVDFFNKAVPMFNEKEYEEACKYFDLAVIVDPENPLGYKERGLCYLQMGKIEQAVEDLTMVIEADTAGAEIEARYTLANIYYRQKDYDKAVPLLKDVLEENPQDIQAISKLALIYQDQGKSDEAVELYETVLKTKQDDPDLWFNIGILYFQMERYEQAGDAFEKVYEINPNDTESLTNLTYALIQAEMFAEAIPYLEKLTEMQPENPEPWRNLAVAYAKTDRAQDANEALKKYKALSGDEK